MSYHSPILPAPADQTRADGWSPALQRRFIETLAATGVITLACDAVRITARSAYNLRNRRDGAAFRLGWDAAILIARARLADDLLARAILGQTESIRHDPDTQETTRHRHDNRLAMSMLSRLDRMADSPAEGSDAALARIVAQDFVAFLDMLCPQEDAIAEADRTGLPAPGPQPEETQTHTAGARTRDDARMLDGAMPDTPAPVGDAVTALSPAASVALWIAARMPLLDGGATANNPHFSVADERCELRPEDPVDLYDLPPEEAVARLRGIWWDEGREAYRTDYPAPPGFEGQANDVTYYIDAYQRDLTPREEAAVITRWAAERHPYEAAAARARDAFFGFVPAQPVGKPPYDDAQMPPPVRVGTAASNC